MWLLCSLSLPRIKSTFLFLSLQHQISCFPHYFSSHGFPYAHFCVVLLPLMVSKLLHTLSELSWPIFLHNFSLYTDMSFCYFSPNVITPIPPFSQGSPVPILSNSFISLLTQSLPSSPFSLLAYCIPWKTCRT